ncbi:hypothetical protein TNCV_3697051 [Trichonephila clavipes]|uniref:Uncharacterized protein n=1 Tax=Trichonephila clavipes TaxID=2585209 RepID=A0A8X6VJ98_TRICX|nr:hypothetical protein TNCV_3697051 [Trichonephila clavipes]
MQVSSTTSGNGSQMMTSSRICFPETFHSAPSITRLPGMIFQNHFPTLCLRMSGAPIAWGPRIIDKVDTAVPTFLMLNENEEAICSIEEGVMVYRHETTIRRQITRNSSQWSKNK